MKLRFRIDQAEALRQGIDAPTSIVTIEIDPQKLTQEERALLADRMDGIDLRELYRPPYIHSSFKNRQEGKVNKVIRASTHITARMATFEALMAAIRANEEQVRTASQPERDFTPTSQEGKGCQ